jgi:hypothetical protein
MKRTILFSLLTMMALLGLWACGGNSARDTGDHFLEATSKGDYAQAKEYATKASWEALDMLANNGNDKKLHPDKIEFLDINVIEDRATYSYKENDSIKNLSLVKEDGKWKVALKKN